MSSFDDIVNRYKYNNNVNNAKMMHEIEDYTPPAHFVTNVRNSGSNGNAPPSSSLACRSLQQSLLNQSAKPDYDDDKRASDDSDSDKTEVYDDGNVRSSSSSTTSSTEEFCVHDDDDNDLGKREIQRQGYLLDDEDDDDDVQIITPRQQHDDDMNKTQVLLQHVNAAAVADINRRHKQQRQFQNQHQHQQNQSNNSNNRNNRDSFTSCSIQGDDLPRGGTTPKLSAVDRRLQDNNQHQKHHQHQQRPSLSPSPKKLVFPDNSFGSSNSIIHEHDRRSSSLALLLLNGAGGGGASVSSPQKVKDKIDINIVDDDDDDEMLLLTESQRKQKNHSRLSNNNYNNNNSSTGSLIFGGASSSLSSSSGFIDTDGANVNYPFESKPFPSGFHRWKNKKTRTQCQRLMEDAVLSRFVADRKMFEAFEPFMSKKFARLVTQREEEATNGDDNDDGTISPLLHLEEIRPVAPFGADPLSHSLATGLNLRNYQVDGVNFLLRNFSRGMSSLLCDEQGLGKTATTCCFLNALNARIKLAGPHLIVAPLSTTSSWRRELERWAPSLSLIKYKGTQPQRLQLQVPGPRVFITTPAVFGSDHKFFSSRMFGVAVVDEAHCLRSDATAINKYASRVNACFRLGLTGTPVANAASELWSIMNFLYPELRKGKSRPDDDDDDDGGGGEASEQAAALLKYVMLRRTKQDILKDLPPKIIHPTEKIEPSHVQALAMERLFLKAPEVIAERMLRSFVFNMLKLNNHPLLFGVLATKHNTTSLGTATAAGTKTVAQVMQRRNKAAKLIYESGFSLTRGLEMLLDSGAELSEEEIITSSAKMVKLDEILTNLSKNVEGAFISCNNNSNNNVNDINGVDKNNNVVNDLIEGEQHVSNRVLIFSKFSTQLDILEGYCVLRGYRYERLDGSTFHAERELAMARFNHPSSQVFLFLITTTAGGVGITLTGANHVIFYDTTYNPQTDRQAADRAHRIGQTRVVHIHRLCVAGSIEESVLERAAKKAKMGDFVIDGIGTLRDDDDHDDDFDDDHRKARRPIDIDEDDDDDDDGQYGDDDESARNDREKPKSSRLSALSSLSTVTATAATKNPLTSLSTAEMKALIAQAAKKNRMQLLQQQQRETFHQNLVLSKMRAEPSPSQQQQQQRQDSSQQQQQLDQQLQQASTRGRRQREDGEGKPTETDGECIESGNFVAGAAGGFKRNLSHLSDNDNSSNLIELHQQNTIPPSPQAKSTASQFVLASSQRQHDMEVATELVSRIFEAILHSSSSSSSNYAGYDDDARGKGDDDSEDDDGAGGGGTFILPKLSSSEHFRKTMVPSEDVQSICFGCKERTHPVRLLHCTACVKSYHNRASCLGGIDPPDRNLHNWVCPRHKCAECEASGHSVVMFNCTDCLETYCVDCLPAAYLNMASGDGSDLPFVSARYQEMDDEGMVEKRTMKYIRCEVCAHRKRVADGESDEEDASEGESDDDESNDDD